MAGFRKVRKFKKRIGGLTRKPTNWSRIGRNVGGALSLARSAYRGYKYVKSLINVEKNFFDTNRAISAQTSTATVANLSNIAQGDDYNNRQGNSVLLQSMLLRVVMQGTTSLNTFGGDIIRVIVFQDNDQRGTDPTAADLLEDTTVGYRQIVSPLLHTVYKRFNIIVDKTFTLGSAQVTATQSIGHGPMQRVFKVFKKFKDNHIRFSSTAGADASNYEGALYIMTFSTLASDPASIGWHCRLRYTDN